MSLEHLSDAELEKRRPDAALVLNAPTSSELDKANAQETIRLVNQEMDRRRQRG